MLSSWFGSKSSRRSHHRQQPSSSPPALDVDDAQPGLSDVSSVSPSLQTPSNLTSTSDVPLNEAHAHINDPSIYAPTSSLIHSAEKDAGTLRTSDAPTHPHDATHIAAPPEGTPFTPQDAIVAQVFGKSVPPASDRAYATPSLAPQPSVSVATSDSLPLPPSTQTASAHVGPTLTVYDPFSGVRLGEPIPMSLSTATPGDPSSLAPLPTAGDRKLWSSLERILELQAEIAAMHANMEGVGGKGSASTHAGGAAAGTGEGSIAGPKKRSRRDQTLPIGDEEPEEHVTGGAVSENSTDHSDGDEGDGDEDRNDIRGYGKRRRDEEFARLAEQFAQRKSSIGGIMKKLDDLSTALKAFHTLPPPLFDLAVSPSRTDTLSSVLSNVSTPSPAPLHAYRGRSSPLSFTPPQTGKPVSPPSAHVSPPVPPISTLVPPVSLESSNASLGRGSIVAPVLSRMAPPTIMLGTPHVESPADMNPVQSIF